MNFKCQMTRLLPLLLIILDLSAMIASGQEIFKFRDEDGDLRRFRNPEGEVPHIQIVFENKFVWKLWYIAIATRSEGMHGDLLDTDGKRVVGKSVGERRVVQNVVFIWEGPLEGRENLFDSSGWLPEDSSRYAPSSMLIEKDLKKNKGK